jgi:VanZ family protein
VPQVGAPDGTDKLVHVLLYGVLSRSWRARSDRPRGGWTARCSSVAGVSLFGYVDEWHQKFIPGRGQDHLDWVADTVGGVTGLLLLAALRRRERST